MKIFKIYKYYTLVQYFFFQIDPNAFHAKINIMEDVAQPVQLPELLYTSSYFNKTFELG